MLLVLWLKMVCGGLEQPFKQPLVYGPVYNSQGWPGSLGQGRVCVCFEINFLDRKEGLTQGCPQDVKSGDRDETETVNLQDRDETETFHFFKLSRPRWDRDVEPSRPRRDETFNLQDRDQTRRSKKTSRDWDARPGRSKKRIKTAVSQFENTNWWSLSLDNLFLAGHIHYFLRDIFTLHACSQD